MKVYQVLGLILELKVVIINKNSKYDALYTTTVSVLIKATTNKYSVE